MEIYHNFHLKNQNSAKVTKFYGELFWEQKERYSWIIWDMKSLFLYIFFLIPNC